MPVSIQLIEHKEKAPRAQGRPAKENDAFLPEGVQALFEKEPPPAIGRGRRILVVDDNEVILKAFELKLSSHGFAVTTSTDGAAVARTAEQTKAELIILDINFPVQPGLEWSGFTIMQWIRRFPELAEIPVVLMTGGDPKNHKEKSLAAGAIAFFQKPVPFKELLAVMVEALARSSEPRPPVIAQPAG